jgi:ATP phosphoribosyltransferase regulatory subunit
VRADHTPQVARIDAHLLNRQGVARLCYCGSVLHTVPAGMTKMREPIQIGAELYGHAGIEADIEILRLLIAALRSAGIAPVHVDLAHPIIYRSLTEALALEPERAELLFHAVQQKDAPAVMDFAGRQSEAAEKLAALTTLNGGLDVLERARKVLPKNRGIAAALDALERLAQACAAPDVELSVDLAELGGFNYESGLAFAAFTRGSPDAIARGGRYDEVGATFGRARPATGFTMDLRQLAALAAPPPRRRAILAPALDDPALAAAIGELRRAGEIVVVDLPGHDDAVKELECDRRLVNKDGKWRAT